MDFVPISGGMIADDPLPQNLVRYGAVRCDYRMGKHEVGRPMITVCNALSGGPAITIETMAQGGNAMEWVESAEVAPSDAPDEDRVVRGGCWYLSKFWLRSTRQGEPTTMEAFAVGFRVASKSPVLRMLNPRRLVLRLREADSSVYYLACGK